MRGLIAPAVVAVLCAGCAASGGDRPFVPADRATSAGAVPATPSDTGTRPAPAASSAAPRPSAGVQTLSVGRSVKVLMEWPAGLDPGEIEMIEAYRDYYVAAWKAIATRGRDTDYVSFLEFEAVPDSEEWVSGFVDNRRSIRGTARLYLPKVTSASQRGGQVTICVEESGLRLTDVTTGRALATQPSWTKPPRSTYLQGAVLRRSGDVWRIRSLLHAELPHDRAKGCKR